MKQHLIAEKQQTGISRPTVSLNSTHRVCITGLCLLLITIISACSTTSRNTGIFNDGLAAPVEEVPAEIVEQKPKYTFESEQRNMEELPPVTDSKDYQQKRAPTGTVIALLNQARDQQRNGKPERAAAVLERALRIDPKNAKLWSELAQVRLQQGKLDQAESLATKSNALVGGDETLRQRNDNIIKQARYLRGG